MANLNLKFTKKSKIIKKEDLDSLLQIVEGSMSSFFVIYSFLNEIYFAKPLYEIFDSLVTKAGGKIVKEPQESFWGGYHAYFSDLDGYYWEVAWGPNFKFDENGLLKF